MMMMMMMMMVSDLSKMHRSPNGSLHVFVALDSMSDSNSSSPSNVSSPADGGSSAGELAHPPSIGDAPPPPPPLVLPPPVSNSSLLPSPSPSNSSSSSTSPPSESNTLPSNSQPPSASSSPPPSPPSASPPPPPPPSKSPPNPPPPPPPKPSPNVPPPPSPSASPPPPPAQKAPAPSSDVSFPPPSSPSSPTVDKAAMAPLIDAGSSPPPPPVGGSQQSSPPPTENESPPAPPVSNGLSESSTPDQSLPKVPSTVQYISPSPPTSRSTSSNHLTRSPPATENLEVSTAAPVAGSDTVGNTTKAVFGTVVAGMVVIAIITTLLVARRRKRREPYASHYMPPNSFPTKTDTYYYGQPQHSMGFSGSVNHSYGSQTPHSLLGDSYGSQRGNLYNGGGSDSAVIGGVKSFFSYDEVMEMTSGFSRQNIVGEGGFGCVFKGCMPDGRAVAVKQLKAGSGQGDREFKAEVEIISRVHHRHLVSLVGYCIADHQRLLIYEFVSNKTLEYHLHARGLPVLDWQKRLKIAIGSAKGLAYLHDDCHPKIIHRDIKSANILLDDSFEAQVADFGLAKLNDTTQTHVSTRVMGTFGYLAPEYASSGKLTDRSDVFSFGVVLLELVTGRKPVDPTQPLGDESLVEWARPLLIHALETGDLGELVDARLEKQYVESEMFRMVETAAACVRHSAPKRPRMVQVVRALDCEGEMSDLSNGVKYGQSAAYDSGQYSQDIKMFRRMALGSNDSSEFGSVNGGEPTPRGPLPSGDLTGPRADQRYSAAQGSFVGRRF